MDEKAHTEEDGLLSDTIVDSFIGYESVSYPMYKTIYKHL